MKDVKTKIEDKFQLFLKKQNLLKNILQIRLNRLRKKQALKNDWIIGV